jgi:tryptophan synthase alpha chain
MNRIDKTFEYLKRRGEKGLISFITAGYPDIGLTRELIIEMEKTGVDVVEIGVPFSDPLADGPIIQKASERALKNGINLRIIMDMVRTLRTKSEIPLVLMGYYNPIFRYGEENFIKDAVRSGIDGVIIPDLPPEEGVKFIKISKKYGLDVILLLAPTSPEDRIKLISELSSGFIYYVSLAGVTGIRERLSDSLNIMIKRIKKHTVKPVAVGFGISKPEHAKIASKEADGVVVGSAIIKIIEENLNSRESILERVSNFIKGLKEGLKGNFINSNHGMVQ